jgi:hypothetical protein
LISIFEGHFWRAVFVQNMKSVAFCGAHNVAD